MTLTAPFRVKLAVAHALGKMGKIPSTVDQMREPLEKRAALKPARWMLRKLPSDVEWLDQEIPGRDGPLTVPVHTPHTRSARGLVYFHGGGFVVGSVEACHHLCVDLASASGATIVSVDYRLAPDAPFPAGLDDCEDALRWTHDHTERLGLDRAHIAIGGDSAGGNLVAALALRLKRQNDGLVSKQVIIYPILDLNCTAESWTTESQQHDSGVRTRDALKEHYVGASELNDPLISPLCAPDLSGLPPALIMTSQHDTLRDDGRAYAKRLRAAGVPTRYSEYARMPHGFLSQPRLASSYDHGIGEIASFLRD